MARDFNIPDTIWTIGHSTRPIEEFTAALHAHGIKLLADVRLLPGSKRYPHFNNDALAAALAQCGIAYEHFRDLGGRRRPRPDSQNTAWRNEAFRGYADHMETPVFEAAIARLLESAAAVGPTALMCAEAVWWRCHRGLVSDYLKVRGVEVLHIVDGKKAEPHPFTSAATVVDGRLSYAAADELFPPGGQTRSS
jgi:uncharacterized protein (DUF488 family)